MASFNINMMKEDKFFETTKIDHSEIKINKGDLKSPMGFSYTILQEIVNFLLSRITTRPKVGLICGSGIGPLAESISDAEYIPYEEIPNFPVCTVEGHQGRLVFGKLSGVPVVAMQGRVHYYEGYPLWKCCLPVRVMKLIGVQTLIITNASGGVNSSYKVGDLMIIKDHINMMGFSGNHSLHGPNEERLGSRFPSMNRAYNAEYRKIAAEVAQELSIGNIVQEGVYACHGGPSFETVAEIKVLKMLGADAVGMSTAHEVITARHCKMNVFALSMVTNKCASSYDVEIEANHEEVLDVGRMRQDVLRKYISQLANRFYSIENKSS